MAACLKERATLARDIQASDYRDRDNDGAPKAGVAVILGSIYRLPRKQRLATMSTTNKAHAFPQS